MAKAPSSDDDAEKRDFNRLDVLLFSLIDYNYRNNYKWCEMVFLE
ncbi:MAG: hypothetical protein R3Y53_08000 [Bacillota bacterium]